MLSYAEENYLKAIYHLSEENGNDVSTNALSDKLQTKPASVTDMIKKLAAKGVITYRKYQGVSITPEGKKAALMVVRKHRLWEVFLVEKLGFNWDEVHEIAEQLEHIKSPLLIERLDHFLGFPKYDPHGDPIPDAQGEIKLRPKIPVSEMEPGHSTNIVAVRDSDPQLLQYLDKVGINIGMEIQLIEKIPFDGSMQILLQRKKELFISKVVGDNILVLA